MVIHPGDIYVIEERLYLSQMTPTRDFVSCFNLFVTVQIFEGYCLPHFLLIGAATTFGPGYIDPNDRDWLLCVTILFIVLDTHGNMHHKLFLLFSKAYYLD